MVDRSGGARSTADDAATERKGHVTMGARPDSGDRGADEPMTADLAGEAVVAESLGDALAVDALAAAAIPAVVTTDDDAGTDSAGRGAASSAAEFSRLSAYLVFNIASFLLIIRYLPKGEMGWYALVNVVVNLAYVIAELQMEKVAVRRITQGMAVDEVIGSAVGVRLAGSLVATLVTQVLFVAIGLARGGINGELQLAGLLASSQFFGESFFVVGSAFQAQLRAYLDVIPRITYVVLRFGLTLGLLALDVPWWALFLAWVGAYAIADVLALVLFRVKTHVSWRPRLQGTGRLVREALTLGVAGFLGMATVQWGTLYLGFTGEPKEVAVFNTAILPIQYLSMFASVIAIVAFPLVSSAWARRDPAAFGRIDGAARTAIIALFLPVTVLFFEAPLHDVMEKVFGKGYGAAAQPMRLMSIALILASIMVWAGFVLLAVGHLRAIITINGLCLIIGVIASPFVVPTYGIDGLGALGIAATAVGVVTAGILLARDTPASFDMRGTVRVLLCGVVLWLALTGVRSFTDSFLVLVAVTAVLYPVLILAARVLRSDVIDDLRAGTTAESRDDHEPVPSELAGGGAA